jgi:hypothetical protein
MAKFALWGLLAVVAVAGMIFNESTQDSDGKTWLFDKDDSDCDFN